MQPERCEEGGFDSAGLSPPDATARLRDTAAAWADVVDGVDDGADDGVLRRRPSPDRWSVVEYTVHATAVVAAMHQAMTRGATEELPALPNTGSEPTAASCDAPVGALLADLRSALGSLADDADRLDDGSWARAVVSPSGHRLSLSWVLFHGLHDAEHHLLDIRRNLSGH